MNEQLLDIRGLPLKAGDLVTWARIGRGADHGTIAYGVVIEVTKLDLPFEPFRVRLGDFGTHEETMLRRTKNRLLKVTDFPPVYVKPKAPPHDRTDEEE